MRGRPHGVIIPTALFVVLLLFSMVAAVHLMVRQNFHTTRYGHLKVQARQMAHAAVNKALWKLNNDPGFEAQYLIGPSENKPHYVEPVDGGGSLEAWLEPSNQENVLLLMGKGNTGSSGLSESAGATILRRPSATGYVFARPGGDTYGDRATTLYYMAGDKVANGGDVTAADWKMVPPLPNRLPDLKGNMVDNYYSKTQASSKNPPKYGRNISCSTADLAGNMYVVRVRSGESDRVCKFNAATSQWSVLPDVPGAYYKSDFTRVPAAGFDDKIKPNLTDLTSDGKNKLYGRFARDGIDTVYTMDLSAETPAWTTIAPPNKIVYNNKGEKTEYKTAVPTLKDYTADSKGNLYARFPTENVDTLYHYADGKWDTIPPPPRAYYRKTADGLVPTELEDRVAYNLKGISVDTSGTLYAIFNRDGIDTTYRYDRNAPAGTPPWEMMKPPPRAYVTGPDQTAVGEDNDTQAAPNLRQTAVDANDRLYSYWRRDGVDSVFQYNAGTGNYAMLPPIPRKFWLDHDDAQGNPAVDDRSGKTGSNGLMTVIKEIAGGGQVDASAPPHYEQVSSF